MTVDGISFTIGRDDQISEAIARLVANVDDLEPALDEIGASNVLETQMRFESQTDPDGKDWKELSETTKLLRRGDGSLAKILRDAGHLYDSITHAVDAAHGIVTVGTNRIYARIHQLGGQAGRGHKVTIPARPYLGMSPDGEEEVLRILEEHVTS
jgi:phage virion morphogenesis protein